MAGSSNSDTTFPMNSIMHMIHIKLSAINYLVWKHHLQPILICNQLFSHVDGSSHVPLAELTTGDKVSPNLDYTAWLTDDQRVVIILQASLTLSQ
ncbi:hypothetical protein HanHA300_Chr03g0104601 [Helianthus annuus]|nr:hypothetical protein HanHA300_Chr03g0104601 [Helianthus annuus]KAJ0609111.1 hypothetical protein HanHA89_Chr03g0116311 [Helianthus annuus]KAJ0769177.1 hypothetical protein HanLR1_Chr03g0109841 [Helianthus annuus]